MAKSNDRGRTRRILVVDDDADVAEAIFEGLKGRGYQVEVFTDPSKALEVFKPGLFDVALLDLRMQPMDGVELYHRLRQVDSRIVGCFLSAYGAYAETVKDWPEEVKLLEKPISTQYLDLALRDITSAKEKGHLASRLNHNKRHARVTDGRRHDIRPADRFFLLRRPGLRATD